MNHYVGCLYVWFTWMSLWGSVTLWDHFLMFNWFQIMCLCLCFVLAVSTKWIIPITILFFFSSLLLYVSWWISLSNLLKVPWTDSVSCKSFYVCQTCSSLIFICHFHSNVTSFSHSSVKTSAGILHARVGNHNAIVLFEALWFPLQNLIVWV